MKRVYVALIAASLIGTPVLSTNANAAPKDGRYSVTVASKSPFDVTVTLRNGNLSGLGSKRLTDIKVSKVTGNTKKQTLHVTFKSQKCGSGSNGQMTFDLKGAAPILTNWKGKCGGKSFNNSMKQKATLVGG